MRRAPFAARRRHPRPSLPTLSQSELNPLLTAGGGVREHDLSRLSLVKKDLRGADFSCCEFHDADLRGARLQGADLSDCSFARANMHGARLEGALLRGADLTRAYGLTQDQLRGTRLSGAKLPANLFNFDGLDRVRDVVNRAERTLYVLLLACASVLVICVTSSDEQLFQPGTALTLPGLNLPVPLIGFYQLAPLLLLGFYLSLSFTLRKLWIELGNLPAQFPNDRWLYRQAASSTPSFVSVLGPHLHVEPRQPRLLGELLLMMVAVWGVTPAVLYIVLESYLARHDPTITFWHVAVLAATVLAGILFIFSMFRILSHSFCELRAEPAEPEGSSDGSSPAVAEETPSACVVVESTNSSLAGQPDAGHAAPQQRTPPATPQWRASSFPARPGRGVLREGLLAASLVVAATGIFALHRGTRDAMDRGCPADLLMRAAEKPDECNGRAANLLEASLERVQLPHGNLRRGFLRAANLQRANLERADLAYANLSEARLAGANLQDAKLNAAVLWEADLDAARLKEATARKADLRGASLRLAEVQGADFTGADLRGVEWTGALVCGMILDSARVDRRALQRANGWRRVGLPLLRYSPDSLRILGSDTIPEYLSGRDATEYVRWRRAWRASRSEPAGGLAAGRLVPFTTVYAYLDTLDVSMGSARQRHKEKILRHLGTLGGHGENIVVTPQLRDEIARLRGDIESKAVNHCVDVNASCNRSVGCIRV